MAPEVTVRCIKSGLLTDFPEFYRMGYVQFSADRIFDGYRFRDGEVLVTKEDGTIVDWISRAAAGADLRHLEGTLCPGFVNAHCHLELSHLKNVIPPHTGLIEFLCSVVTKRGFPAEFIQQEIESAEAEMYRNGIVAVGDIGNTADTARVKRSSRIAWQNFVEVLSFTDEKADENLRHYQSVLAQLESSLQDAPVPHRSSLVPHAPYSISPKTFEAINRLTEGQVISIHNQEHPAEDELYRTGGGEYLRLFRIFGLESSPFPVTGKSSLRSVLPYFDRGQTILLVHNTFLTEEDLDWAEDLARQRGLKLVWCLCINANLYIENRVPPATLLYNKGVQVALGTDSYSSNWQLSIAREIASLRSHFPALPEETILSWATLGGARALGWDDWLGSLEPGKRPGLARLTPDGQNAERIL